MAPPTATAEPPANPPPKAEPTAALTLETDATATPERPPDADTPPTVTTSPTASSVPGDASLSLYETTLTLPTYGWKAALVPSTAEQPFFPYPTLNFDAVAPPTPRTYTGIVLENTYVRATVLPELGGRVLRWEDKITGQRLTYSNPVIKPTHWGYRGWWLATGGLEWAFPVNEHGLNEYRSWQYEFLSGESWRGVRVWDTDDRTGMTIAVTLRLHASSSALTIAPRITNPTDQPHPLQFWINAMLTLSGGNTPSSALRFWVPTETMMVHSTGDGSLPGPRGIINWPVHAERDFSRYSAGQPYLGLFATEARGAAGAYDESADQGIVRIYPPQIAKGVKIFSLGNLPADLYTDGNSRYVEFWGGLNRTFFPEDDLTVQPGQAIAWEEQWYPAHGIGTLSWANEALAVALQPAPSSVEIGVYAPQKMVGLSLALWQSGQLQTEWTPEVGPGAPFQVHYPGTGGGWTLEVWQAGKRLTEVNAP